MSESTWTTSDAPLGGVLMLGAARSEGAGGAERLAKHLEATGLAVLRVNLTGTSPRSRNDPMAQKVESSIESLSQRCGANGHRIAVLAEAGAASAAVLGASMDGRVRAFVFLSGRLSRRSKDILREWRENPVLCLVGSEDERALRDMSDVYFESGCPDTDIEIFEDLGRGAATVESWASRFPEREPLEETVSRWLRRQLASVGRAREVSFETDDGWEIFGNLLVPDCGDREAAGVILLHSGRSDRYIFADMERMLVREGLAVLNIDWRGRGKSTNKGSYLGLSKTERDDGKLDAKAAKDFLVSQRQVDPDRIGFVGVIHGAEHAVRSSLEDPRVKAIAILSGYTPLDDAERAYVTGGQPHVMFVSSTGHKTTSGVMRSLYEASPDKLSRFFLFEGGAIGYQLFELDDKLERDIVAWLVEGLAP